MSIFYHQEDGTVVAGAARDNRTILQKRGLLAGLTEPEEQFFIILLYQEGI